MHPLLPVLTSAAAGRFPPVDGGAALLPALARGFEAVVSFTGRAFLSTALGQEAFDGLTLDGYGAALHPAVLQRLAGPHGWVGVLDLTLVAQGRGSGCLPRRNDLGDHPRVRHAAALREDVRVHGDERGLVTLARGLAGRCETSVETARDLPGTGRSLIEDALALVPSGEPVFAAVAPGNARSLRAFLACGFQPIGSEVLVGPGRDGTRSGHGGSGLSR